MINSNKKKIIPVRTPVSSSLIGAPKQDNNWGKRLPRLDPVRLISTSRPFKLRLLSDGMRKDMNKKEGKGKRMRKRTECLISHSLSIPLSACISQSLTLPTCSSFLLSLYLSYSVTLSLSVCLSLSLPSSLPPTLFISLSLSLSLCITVSLSLSRCLSLCVSLSFCVFLSIIPIRWKSI